jgi:type 1 glutamine amidotransferase
MKKVILRLITIVVLTSCFLVAGNGCHTGKPDLKILVLTERGGQHESFAAAALEWIDELAGENKFSVRVINNTEQLNKTFLAGFDLFVQLDYPPYGWSDEAVKAFEDYIETGRGGWIGFHHATLLGEFDGFSMWKWFSSFMGGIRFENYIAGKAEGIVRVEDKKHPVMEGVPSYFTVTNEEWYTFNKSPRPEVHVLADVDESSYKPASEINMGDHPVIWINEKMKARNVYFLMGHQDSLFENEAFTRMFRNAVFWAGGLK